MTHSSAPADPNVTRPVSPLRAVRSAIRNGSRTVDGVCRATGLDRDVVDASIEHLVRTGVLRAEVMSTGCPSGGCGSCAVGHSGQPGCGAPLPSDDRRGPVLVTLTMRKS